MEVETVGLLRSTLLLLLLFAAFLKPLRSEDIDANQAVTAAAAAEEELSRVLVLDGTNFSETISKHPFVVVEFYAPWCGHCKRLAPHYEKAAAALIDCDPPILLAKIDVTEAINKDIAKNYEVRGYPTLKILRNGGKNTQNYDGPRDAEGIIEYLKKQLGPASAEINSSEEARNHIDEKKIFIVGVFPEFSGKEYENFVDVAENLRGQYYFGHTLDASFLPLGDSSIKNPTVRLFKPFDELSVDFLDFKVDALQNFIETASLPIITVYNTDIKNEPYINKFFRIPNTKAMLFLNFSHDNFDLFETEYRKTAEENKGKDIIFLIGDLDVSGGVLSHFGVNEEQTPFVIIQDIESVKYLKANIQPYQIASWIENYKDGKLTPFRKSEPIPQTNDEPVKIVVADSLDDIVFNSGKNVLLEFYSPWCKHCKNLAPIFEEVAVSFQDDDEVVIAKMDATENDVPKKFEIRGYPTLYFSSATNEGLVKYNGDRTFQDIVEFVKKHKHTNIQTIDLLAHNDIKDEL